MTSLGRLDTMVISLRLRLSFGFGWCCRYELQPPFYRYHRGMGDDEDVII